MNLGRGCSQDFEVEEVCDFFAISVELCRKRCTTRSNLLLFTNRKSHIAFDWYQNCWPQSTVKGHTNGLNAYRAAYATAWNEWAWHTVSRSAGWSVLVGRRREDDGAGLRYQSRRLDYCNALCYGITDELTNCLQSVQNAAARLVAGIRRCVLRQLHWLPVRQRVVFKIATVVYRSLSGNGVATSRVT